MRARAPVVALVLAAAACAVAADGELPAWLLDPAADRVVARTVVPDATRKVGEVRLIERGAGTVVQTLLVTRVLGRVVAEIRKKEERNWPHDAEGYDDMRRYVDAVGAAADTLRAHQPESGDRRQRLLIEFLASEGASGVLLAEFEGDEVDGAIQPRSRRPLATLPLRRAYVFPNMRFILADSFHVPEPDVGRLGPLGPIAAPSERAPAPTPAPAP
jgi:hypothetical protein